MPKTQATIVPTTELHDCHSNSVTFGKGFTFDLGPNCWHCKTNEAQCANTDSRCCPDCTHRFGRGLRYQPRRHAS